MLGSSLLILLIGVTELCGDPRVRVLPPPSNRLSAIDLYNSSSLRSDKRPHCLTSTFSTGAHFILEHRTLCYACRCTL